MLVDFCAVALICSGNVAAIIVNVLIVGMMKSLI